MQRAKEVNEHTHTQNTQLLTYTLTSTLFPVLRRPVISVTVIDDEDDKPFNTLTSQRCDAYAVLILLLLTNSSPLWILLLTLKKTEAFKQPEDFVL